MVTAESVATFLIIGDNSDNQAALRAGILEHLGEPCEIATADESRALATAAGEQPDVALIDMRTPDADGIELCRLLKTNTATAHIPIILLIASDQDAAFIRRLEAGALDIIQSPVENIDIVARIRVILRMKRAEDALRDTRERLGSLLKDRTRQLVDNEYYYRALLHGLHDVVIVIDSDYVIVDANNAFLASTGRHRRDILGKHCYKIFYGYDTPCQHAGELCPLPVAFRTGEPCHCQHVHIRADGSRAHVDILMSPLADENGNITHVVEAARDITLLVEAQEELVRQHDLLNAVIEGTDDAIFVKDMHGRYLLANAAACRAMGKSLEHILGQRGDEIFSPEMAQSFDESDELVLTSGRSHIAEQTIPHNGTVTTWLAAKFPRRDASGKVIGLIGISRDISDRKRAEEELRKERNVAESLIATAQTIILILDTEGRILRFNPYMEKISGYRLEEVVGKDWFTTFTPKQDQDRIRAIFLNTTEDIETRGNVNAIVTRDGRERRIEWYDKTLKDEQGNLIGLLSTGQDITERELLEEEFRQAQKMEAIGQLAGGVAHDFKNQLTVIRGYAEMLLRRSLVTDDGRSRVEEIIKAADRSAKIASQLLAFSRRETLCPQVVDLDQVAQEIAPMLAQLVGDDINLAIMPSSDTCEAKVDPSLLQQAIMNLVVNARHAMSDGGQLTIETRRAGVDDEMFARYLDATADGYAVISIADTGDGIDEQTLERIFDPFFTTKEVGKGTGMGLAMVQGFVAQSGGFVDVQTELGKGSTFSLCFPCAWSDQPRQMQEPTPSSGQSIEGDETILLVEDEEQVRHLVGTILRDLGYTVLEAANADQALPLGEHYRWRIHLLLTDIAMPGCCNGAELARRFRSGHPEMAVLFVSGNVSNSLKSADLAHPRTDLITKPFTHDELGQKIRQLLRYGRDQQ